MSLVNAVHDGYSLVPERIRGFSVSWLRLNVAVSRSSVLDNVTTHTGSKRLVSARRHGLTVRCGNRVIAFYLQQLLREREVGVSAGNTLYPRGAYSVATQTKDA